MVVRYPRCLAQRDVPKPRPPRAEDGAAPPPNAAADRQLGRRGGHLAQRAHGLACGAQRGSRAPARSDQHGGEEPEAAEAPRQAVHWGHAPRLGGYELSGCLRCCTLGSLSAFVPFVPFFLGWIVRVIGGVCSPLRFVQTLMHDVVYFCYSMLYFFVLRYELYASLL